MYIVWSIVKHVIPKLFFVKKNRLA